MQARYRVAKQCRGCQHSLEFAHIVIDLGNQYVVDFVEAEGEGWKVPLLLVRCTICNLVQLMHTTNQDKLYKQFWYRSGINESMREALKDVAKMSYLASNAKAGDAVLDIGCNDGTLLGMYPKSLDRVGVDPCEELVDEAVKTGRATEGHSTYFNKDLFGEQKFKIITAVAMFYDLDDPIKFLEDCKELLDRDGVLVIQMNYLLTMLQGLAFDNICHEHLTYFSMTTFKEIVRRAGLECQGASTNSINGGSFRVYITHPRHTLHGLPINNQVELHAGLHSLLLQENQQGLHTDMPYIHFMQRTKAVCNALKTYINRQPKDSICVYGASTRGSTLLQALELSKGQITHAAERDEKKLGLYTVGTNLKITTEDYARDHYKQFLVLPYHFAETIKRREDQWLAKGGKLLFPLPMPHLLSFEDQEIVTPLMSEVA